MDLGQWTVIILSIFMGVWFVVGAFVNRRRGVATYQWLRTGLEKYGKITEAKWIGSASSGARLAIDKAEAPFRRIETVFLLDSREIFPLWLFNRLRNKTDEMVLRANLRKVPAYQIDIARSGKLDIDKLTEQIGPRHKLRQSDMAGFTTAIWGNTSPQDETALESFLQQYSSDLLTISARRSSPHLILKVRLPDLISAPAEDFLAALETWLNGMPQGEPDKDQ